MTTHLIELALGPVQGFIAAARRSRDLWAGSYLLSGCARAAGKALLDGGATLIYPVAERVHQISDEENSNLSNVLLASVECDSAEAATLARKAQEAARSWLRQQADDALREWKQVGVREDIWARQVADALESFGAWCRVDSDYRTAYNATKAALGARKNTRNFIPMFEPEDSTGAGIPKSSLDGLRESVLPKDGKRFPAKFGVAAGEQLDALGCIKREIGRSERFTALTRIAADGWLQQLTQKSLEKLRAAYEPLVGDYATRSEGNAGCYADFPFDAGLLYPERLDVAIRDAQAEGVRALADLSALKRTLGSLWKEYGPPCPYAAIVVADGDRMGRFIDKAQTAQQHSAVSRAIAAFADQVPEIARKHRGHSIYNGGEDLMVLFPLAGVVEGSRALADAFNNAMQGVINDLLGAEKEKEKKNDDLPTLRVGAAICHVQEPLGLIRQYGDAAEKFAKGDAGVAGQGNALGIQLYVRAGHVVPWRARFDNKKQDFEALETWVKDYADGKLPGKLAYRIRQAWMDGRNDGLDADIIRIEVERAIKHASERGGETGIDAKVIERLQARAERWKSDSDPTGHGGLIDELILARWLSARSAKDLGREDA